MRKSSVGGWAPFVFIGLLVAGLAYVYFSITGDLQNAKAVSWVLLILALVCALGFEFVNVRSGIKLVKYWFSITDEEQHFRFTMRIHAPLKPWKLSPMHLESRRRWEVYTRAKEVMPERTDIPEAPWWVVEAVDKKRARLNCINHLLTQLAIRRSIAIRWCCLSASIVPTTPVTRFLLACVCLSYFEAFLSNSASCDSDQRPAPVRRADQSR
jgi:hypothetical protein